MLYFNVKIINKLEEIKTKLYLNYFINIFKDIFFLTFLTKMEYCELSTKLTNNLEQSSQNLNNLQDLSAATSHQGQEAISRFELQIHPLGLISSNEWPSLHICIQVHA